MGSSAEPYLIRRIQPSQAGALNVKESTGSAPEILYVGKRCHLFDTMVNHSLTYRRANASDAPNSVQLTLSACHDYKAVLAPADWASMEAIPANERLYVELPGKAAALVCEKENQLAGVIFLVPKGNPTSIFPADWSYIRLSGVDPTYRGLGIGRKLTHLCIQHARATNETGVALHTGEFMNAARKMFEAIGFKQEKELAPMFGKRHWLYTLNFTFISC